ncbi:Uncharacterized protein SCF082_LOCUS15770 [Durusdinium trenchii]|uniref:Uncharacterized protein n=1 Tax=Durusdinium trenchii TaxID=1381693 RepID=A0ABP0K636_9DINO
MSAHEASDGEVPECDPIGQLLAYFETVNWLQALDTYVPALNTFSRKAHLQLIPDVTMDEFWLPLKCFDISKDAKNGIGYVTAEKMSPSPLSMAGDMEQAVAIERRLSRPGVKTAIRFLHLVAGVSHEVLQADFPGCKSRLEVDAFRGKDVFAEILETTAETANLYFQRAQGKSMETFMQDHQDRSRNALTKSMEAAFSSWCESLKADQAQFQAEQILLPDIFHLWRPDAKRKAEKDEDDEEEKLFGKAQPESDNEAPGEDDKKEESGESALLREASPQTKSATLPHLGRAMTDIQELRQVAGGTPFVRSTMDAFKIPTSKANILIDATGYDGWVARACVEEITEGNSCVCGTVCLDHSGQSLLNGVAQAVYQGCRGSSLQVPGFPHFEPILAALKQGRAAAANTSFQVTVQQADRLLILESLATKWLSSEQTKDRAEEIVKDHNGRFNPDGSLMGDRRTKDQTHLCSCSLQSCVKINPSTS